MDMDPNNPLYPDIVEMEAGVQRCKEIVQNLLGFTRNPNVDEIGAVSVKDICLRALKIVELQTKSQGIEVKLHFLGQDILALGHLNLLAQGLKNILQSSIDRLTERVRAEKGFRGVLDLEITAGAEGPEITIIDNGQPEKNPHLPLGLGLSVASQILRDHEAHMTLTVNEHQENVTRITLAPAPRA